MPKAKFLSSGPMPNKSISVDFFEEAHFPNPLHYHKEYELAYIISGFGKRYIGSNIKSYYNGDLVLVGSELNHVWMSDDAFYEENTNLKTKAIVVKFRADFAGSDFLKLPDTQCIVKAMADASGGLELNGYLKREIVKVLRLMAEQSPVLQILSLLKILHMISESAEVKVLSPLDLHKSDNPKEKERMNRVIQFTMLNFKGNIKLEEIASIANLSKSAFCRYFKQAVKKTYIDFLYEIRIEYACKMLLETKLGITQICYESGFNDPSAFSQIFKRIKGFTPIQYRKKYIPLRTV